MEYLKGKSNLVFQPNLLISLKLTKGMFRSFLEIELCAQSLSTPAISNKNSVNS